MNILYLRDWLIISFSIYLIIAFLWFLIFGLVATIGLSLGYWLGSFAINYRPLTRGVRDWYAERMKKVKR